LAPIWHSKHPTAEKAIQRTKIIFEHMRFSGVECDPFTVDMARHMLGVVHHVPKPTPATPWQDIPELFKSLDRDDASHLCLRFKMLTLVRSNGVRGARFDEITDNVWTVPSERMKGQVGKVSDFRVPLSPAAMEIVRRCEAWKRCEFMFPGTRNTPISEVAINKVFNKHDPDGTPHGLRTSFRTWVQDTDAAGYDVAEMTLAHIVGGKVERAYARSDLLERRMILMEKWADYVTGTEAKVVPIRGSK
jgi:integrase